MKILDRIIFILFIFIFTLWVSGGISYETANVKLELSQIDLFAWMFFLLILIYQKASRSKADSNLPSFFHGLMNKSLTTFNRYPKKTLFIATASTILIRTWLQAWRYDSFHANAYDLSYLDQPIWATNHISFLYSSLAINHTYFGEHFSPILGVISILYRPFDSVYGLFFIQSLILCSAAVLIYKIARHHKLSAGIATYLSLLYFLYQPVRSAGIFDFREDNLFIIFFLALYFFAVKKHWTRFYFTLLCSWLIKENAAIFTLLFSLWMIFQSIKEGQKSSAFWNGVFCSTLSLVVFYVVNQKITPLFSGSEVQTRFAFRLGGIASSAGGFLLFAFTHPIKFLTFLAQSFFQKSVLKYFLVVFTPFVFAMRFADFRAWPFFLISLIGFSLNVILGVTSVGFHYECIFIAFLFIGLVLSVANNKGLQTQSSLFLIALTFFLFYGRSSLYSIQKFWPTTHDRAIQVELSKIPEHASVATQSSIHPHISHRKEALLFTNAASTDYIVIDLSDRYDRYGTPNLLTDASLISSQEYKLETSIDSLRIWKKRTL